MLLTITMNPSVDISYQIDKLVIDDINRTNNLSKTAGGKGLNVARVATQLGADVETTGIIGGYLGEYIKQQLENEHIQHNFYKIDQESRNCIAIIHEGNQTEILENGPTITINDEENFLDHYQSLIDLGKYKLITISGSLPNGMGPDTYRKMIASANEKKIPVILDTSGENLSRVLDDSQLVLKAIKPNIHELNAIEKITVTEEIESIKEILEGPRYKNCEWIIVSLSGKGSLIKHGNRYFRVQVPEIQVVSPVGSGDSSVAGIAYGLLLEQTEEEIMKTGMTTGVLNTMNEKTGFIDKNIFDEIYNQIVVKEVN